MATTYARMRQIIGTTAEWTADNIVLAVGELGIEKATGSVIRIRVGDGVLPFLSLPIVSGDADITAVRTNAAGSGLTGGTESGIADLKIDFTVAAPLAGPVFTGTPAKSADLSLAAVANELATAKFVKGQGFLTTGTAPYLPLAGGTMTTPGNITGFTNSTINFANYVGITGLFSGLVRITTTSEAVTQFRVSGLATSLRILNSIGTGGTIEGRDAADTTYMPLVLGGDILLFNVGAAEAMRLNSTGFGIGGTPTVKLDVMTNVSSESIVRQYNASTGGTSRVNFLQNAGGRVVNRRVDYTTKYLHEFGAVGGIEIRYSDFTTHYWRGSDAGTLMSLSGGNLHVYGPGSVNYGLIGHTDAHFYIRAVNATGNLYLGASNISNVAVTSASLQPVTTKGTTLGDAAHLWNGLHSASAVIYGATSGEVTMTAPAAVAGGGVNVTLPNFSGTVALLESPALTGAPTTPDPSVANENNSTIANTRFVQQYVMGGSAPINSPVFTGDPRITTDPPELDSDTSIPSTNWVDTWFARLKGATFTGQINTNSLINSTVVAGSAAISALGIVKGGIIRSEAAADATHIWNATANAANTRLWYARHLTTNVLRFSRWTDAPAENTTTGIDFRADGNIEVGTAAPQTSAQTGRGLATFDYVKSVSGSYLPLTGGTITGSPGTLTVTGNVSLSTGGGAITTVPLPPAASNDVGVPATTKWIRDLLLNRAGTIARYQMSALTDADVDPTTGKFTVEDLGLENGFSKRRVAMSATDYNANVRYLMMLLPGNSLIVTDDPQTAPVTGFARYVVITKPIQTPAAPAAAVWIKFDSYRVEFAGTQPVSGNVVVVTGFLNSATGDGPVTGVNAGINLDGGGNSGIVTIDLADSINTKAVLVDWDDGHAGQVALDAIDIAPRVKNTVSGGRMRWRGGTIAVSAKDFLMDSYDNDFRFFTYDRATNSTPEIFGYINLTSGAFRWDRSFQVRPETAGTWALRVSNYGLTRHWQVIPDITTSVAEVGYQITSTPTWGTTRHQGVAEFEDRALVKGRLSVITDNTYGSFNIYDVVDAPLISYLVNTSAGASATTQFTQQTSTSLLHRILTATSLREYASAAVTVFYRDNALHSFRGATGTNGIDIEGRTIKFYGSTSGTSVLQAQAVAGTTTFTLPATSGTLALTTALGGYLPLTGGTLTGALTGTTASFSGALSAASATVTGQVDAGSILADTGIFRESTGSGVAADTWGNNLVIDSSNTLGLTFTSPNTESPSIIFKDPEASSGGISYAHGTDTISFTAGGTVRLTMSTESQFSHRIVTTHTAAGQTFLSRGSGAASGKAIRMYHSTATSFLEGVDHTGSASYQPLTIRADPLTLYGSATSNFVLGSSTVHTGAFTSTGQILVNSNIVTDGGYMHVSRGASALGSSAYLYLDSAGPQTVTGAYSYIWFRAGTSARWAMGKTNAVESGTPVNNGSDFIIYAYDDSGGTLGTSMFIERSTRNFGINTTVPTNQLYVAVASYAGQPVRGITIHNTSSGSAWVPGEVNQALDFSDADTSGGVAGTRWRIGTAMSGGTGSSSSLHFQLADTATGVLSNAAYFNWDGTLYLPWTAHSTTGTNPKLYIQGNVSRGAWINGVNFLVAANTITDTASAAAAVITTRIANHFGQPTFASTNAITVTNAVALYVGPAPVAGTNTTITNSYALYSAGSVYISGDTTLMYTGFLEWAARTKLSAAGNGYLDITNNAGTAGIRLDMVTDATLQIKSRGGVADAAVTTGTIVASGAIRQTNATSNGHLILDATTAGKYSIIYFYSQGENRWYMGRNATAEVEGTNVGSDFVLVAYADDGATAVGTALTIRRGTRVTEFPVSPTAPTPANTDSSTNVATTAFVRQQMPAGAIVDYAGAAAPTGWLLCQGQAVSRTTYAALYTALGGAASVWGQGDGSTTFNVPDLGGRVTAGKEATATRLTAAGSGITGSTLASAGGAQTHPLVIGELAAHNHVVGQAITSTGGGASVGYVGTTGGTTGTTGSGTAHQNTQPTIIMNKIIKT